MSKRTLSITTALIAIFALVGCSDTKTEPAAEQQAAAMPAPTVSVMTAAAESVTIWDELPGRVHPFRIAEIRPQVGGIVTKRLFEEGAEVQSGQPLYELDPARFQAEVMAAEANLERANAVLEQADSDLQRAEGLISGNTISRQNFDGVASLNAQAKAGVSQAQAALDTARISLAFATVKAPIYGEIGASTISEGALADPASTTSMATIQQIDRVFVDVRQSTARMQQARVEQATNGESSMPVKVHVGAANETPIDGKALFSDITVNPTTGNVSLRVLVENPDKLLLPGMFVRASVPRATYADAIMVPQQAVLRDLTGQPAVFLVDAEGNATRTPVTLGELVDRRYRIAKGVAVGDSVMVEGQDRVPTGGAVAAVPFEPAPTKGE